jgi:hypothetical protein
VAATTFMAIPIVYFWYFTCLRRQNSVSPSKEKGKKLTQQVASCLMSKSQTIPREKKISCSAFNSAPREQRELSLTILLACLCSPNSSYRPPSCSLIYLYPPASCRSLPSISFYSPWRSRRGQQPPRQKRPRPPKQKPTESRSKRPLRRGGKSPSKLANRCVFIGDTVDFLSS